MKTCCIEDCKNQYYSKSFCKIHYDKNRRQGNPTFERAVAKGAPCKIPDCGKSILLNGMCAMHDRRNKRHGDPFFINPKCKRDGGYKTRHKSYVQQWKKDNSKLNGSYNKARKTRMRRSWANERELIQEFYRCCPEGFVVDHIIPLNHPKTSGLHCLANLQYLSEADNLKKSNKWDSTYANRSYK